MLDAGFNSRDPAGRDRSDRGSLLTRGVSTHATLRVATVCALVIIFRSWFQLTRPCGSRLHRGWIGCCQSSVSTHATLRVATCPAIFATSHATVSTHATLRVATCTRRVGCPASSVSTHATLRVATFQHSSTFADHVFQLTRPCGSRHSPAPTTPPRYSFQLTRPCGSRRVRFLGRLISWMFQLTRPCGSRPVQLTVH